MNKHILHAEDSEDDVVLMQYALREAEIEAAYHRVANGADALAYLAGFGEYRDRQAYPEPTVLLLDLKLPRLSGFEVLERVRTNPLTATLPVVILSASMLEKDIRLAESLGANGYLTKPANRRRLIEMVKAIKNYWLETERSPVPQFKVMV